VVGACAAALHYFNPGNNGGLSDFSVLWYGSKLLLAGVNPYEAIGPGLLVDLPWPLRYPAPALIAVAPLTLLPLGIASAAFVFISAALLAFGATCGGWYRLPLFASIPFLNAARVGQPSILITAAFFLPAINLIAALKPQASLPVVISSAKPKAWWYAVIGSVILGGLSFLVFPHWATEWLHILEQGGDFRPAILMPGGFLIALVLIRWRSEVSWLLFASACMPQTRYPYNALILLVVAATYHEGAALSLISSAGWLAAYGSLQTTRTRQAEIVMEAVLVGCCYLPAVLVILRRRSVDRGPFWLEAIRSRRGFR
jgi:hypothetical protein